ncbi:hypothetical protein F2Q69_00022687 [Brassica cretica]|uniref:Uncharacterized protein n=1 Tax=Brassica cretica TaxID=69181 RepID=A0A8S9QCE5_BRACR|nr:hypothetical protein F2Q69_00022687 [Brassica cretica]
MAGSFLTHHVALLDHGVGLDGQSFSCLIVGWPVDLSSPTLGVGRPSVMFLFDCWPVGRPMLRTVRGCYNMSFLRQRRRLRWRSPTKNLTFFAQKAQWDIHFSTLSTALQPFSIGL